jgi:hypothetical protein
MATKPAVSKATRASVGKSTKPAAKAAPKASPKRATKADAPPANDVETFLASFEHPFKAEIIALRQIFLAADPSIADGIKWNAPSFRTSEYFATVNLRAKGGTGIILHFGAKKNAISATGVAIADPDSLLEWLGKDRAMLSFRNMDEIARHKAALTKLIRAWIKHVWIN